MDIYDYAMKMEKDGESFYREMIRNTNHSGINNILTMLADAEVRHYNIFKKMKEGEDVNLTDTAIADNAKSIFAVIKKGGEFSNLNISHIELYRKAQGFEEETEKFYLGKAAEAKDESHKQIFMKIAGEERRHYLILEDIIDMVSMSKRWLENPEWYHLDEY